MTSKNEAAALIVLTFPKGVVADVYALAFESCFHGVQIVNAENLGDARKALANNTESFVVIGADISGASLEDFFRDQAVLAKRAQVFVLGGEKSSIPKDLPAIQVEFLSGQPEMRDIVARVEACLQLSAAAQKFCKISLRALLVRADRLRCDVYLKISSEKYVKVLHAKDRFDAAEYERFRTKGVEDLYLPRAEFLELMDELLEKAVQLNSHPDQISVSTAVDIYATIFAAVNAAYETEGFTPVLQKLAIANVNLAVNTIKRSPKLRELLENLNSNRESYLSWHSTALSFISCKLATELKWDSDSTFYKIALASMLHDITLSKDNLARFKCAKDINEQLQAADRDLVLRHPMEAAQLLRGFDEVPGEVGFVIEQHHEFQDGSGFPKGLGFKDVSPVTALFIISHDIVDAIFDAPPGLFEMATFLRVREEQKIYTKGAFGQVFRALQASVSER